MAMEHVPNVACPECGSTDQFKAFNVKVQEGQADTVEGLNRLCRQCHNEWNEPLPGDAIMEGIS